MARKQVTQARKPGPSKADDDVAIRRSRLMALFALVWVIGVTLLFYSSPLPNSVLPSRIDFWLLLPEILPTALFPSATSSFASILERVPYWSIALVIVASATTTGLFVLGRIIDVKEVTLPLRLGVAGGLGLSLWSLVMLGLGWFGVLQGLLFWGLVLGCGLAAALADRATWQSMTLRMLSWRPSRLEVIAMLVALPFALAILFGASLPSPSFDNREYHLQGPKEFLLGGQIGFLEHNVYTSFPFLAEMLTLLAMVLGGDWWGGAIAGQVVLASFAMFTSLLLYEMGRRVHQAAGWLAVLIWLTSPWCYRVSATIAFVEGPLAYYVTAVLACGIAAWESRRAGWWVIVGLMAGSGMSCKYPGLVQAVVPAGAFALSAAALRTKNGDSFRQAIVPLIAVGLGVVVAFVPWAIKNTVETGNPVYPLAYSVFGGIDLDDAWAAKWAGGHSPPFNVFAEPIRAVPDFFAKLSDVFIKNDWQTPLVATFAPLALLTLVRKRHVAVIAASALTAWLYVVWWAMTHQIDRFWVPMLPTTCLLAAIGSLWPLLADEALAVSRWRTIVVGVLAISLFYHVPFIGSGQAGFQQWLVPYEVASRITADAEPGIKLLNGVLYESSKPLLIGEAQVFDLTMEPVYNTVFDDSIFQQLASADRSLPDADQPTVEPSVLCERLLQAGVTHVFVNWSEVLRYRETYGYTDFVTPARMKQLIEAGVLNRISLDPRQVYSMWENLNESTKTEIQAWGPELYSTVNGVEAFRRFDLYQVRCSPAGD